MGWNPYTPKIDESKINVTEYYKRVCRENNECPLDDIVISDMLKYISEKVGYEVDQAQFIFDEDAEPATELVDDVVEDTSEYSPDLEDMEGDESDEHTGNDQKQSI